MVGCSFVHVVGVAQEGLQLEIGDARCPHSWIGGNRISVNVGTRRTGLGTSLTRLRFRAAVLRDTIGLAGVWLKRAGL